MSFEESIKICFNKYASFNGRASRPEYWWFFLFCLLVSAALGYFSQSLSAVFSIGTLLPSLAVGTRRLHDTGRSGWWQLLWFVPLVGWVVLLIFFVQETRNDL